MRHRTMLYCSHKLKTQWSEYVHMNLRISSAATRNEIRDSVRRFQLLKSSVSSSWLRILYIHILYIHKYQYNIYKYGCVYTYIRISIYIYTHNRLQPELGSPSHFNKHLGSPYCQITRCFNYFICTRLSVCQSTERAFGSIIVAPCGEKKWAFL